MSETHMTRRGLAKVLIVALAFVLMSNFPARSQDKVAACQMAVDEVTQISDASQKAVDKVYEQFKERKGLEWSQGNCEKERASLAAAEISLETALHVEKVCGKRLAARAFPHCDSACWRKWVVSRKEQAKSDCDAYEEALKAKGG